jgi:hypothetical protein
VAFCANSDASAPGACHARAQRSPRLKRRRGPCAAPAALAGNAGGESTVWDHTHTRKERTRAGVILGAKQGQQRSATLPLKQGTCKLRRSCDSADAEGLANGAGRRLGARNRHADTERQGLVTNLTRVHWASCVACCQRELEPADSWETRWGLTRESTSLRQTLQEHGRESTPAWENSKADSSLR